MKKAFLVTIALLAAIYGFFSIPLTSVAVFTLTLKDQHNKPISENAVALFFDKQQKQITKISQKTRGSFANTLVWWSHSVHKTSHLRPKDALRTVSVRIQTNNCQPTTIPIIIHKHYEPLSGSLHGGGAAYYIYSFKKTIQLQCQ